MRYAILTLVACTAIQAAPIGDRLRSVTRQLQDLTEVLDTGTGTVPTGVTSRSDDDDYIVQGPNYEDASNDLLASLLDPGYGDDGSDTGALATREEWEETESSDETEPSDEAESSDDSLDYSGNVSILDDLTHLDLSDLSARV